MDIDTARRAASLLKEKQYWNEVRQMAYIEIMMNDKPLRDFKNSVKVRTDLRSLWYQHIDALISKVDLELEKL